MTELKEQLAEISGSDEETINNLTEQMLQLAEDGH